MKEININTELFFDYYRKNDALEIYHDYINNEIISAKSGIKIKKKNRGKFTEYCGGKVTDSCISKAKNSGNPTLVKRATFADNARGWSKKKK